LKAEIEQKNCLEAAKREQDLKDKRLLIPEKVKLLSCPKDKLKFLKSLLSLQKMFPRDLYLQKLILE